MNVLVVDDSRVVRTIMRNLLTDFGYAVTVAEDGCQATDLFHADPFDIVITDWAMPGMDGIELIWNIRANYPTNYTYLILMTSSQERDRHIEGLDAGADDFIQKPPAPEVLRARVRAASRMVTTQRELARLACIDPLTGALNRRAFMDRAREEVERARRKEQPVSVLMLDIDHFKKINDAYGHHAGDEALRLHVDACRKVLRPSDLLGRLGGEEFAILLPDTTAADAFEIAERVRQAVGHLAVDLPEGRFGFTASIGIAAVQTGAKPLETALALADAALYAAKSRGRNRVELAHPALQREYPVAVKR